MDYINLFKFGNKILTEEPNFQTQSLDSTLVFNKTLKENLENKKVKVKNPESNKFNYMSLMGLIPFVLNELSPQAKTWLTTKQDKNENPAKLVGI